MKNFFRAFAYTALSIIMIFAFFFVAHTNGYTQKLMSYVNSNAVVSNNGFIAQVPMAYADTNTGNQRHTCIDNYNQWPSSLAMKDDSPWATVFMGSNYIHETQRYFHNPLQFLGDINGDSLPDYVYVRHSANGGGSGTMEDCVYLNNGQGWDLEYRCVSAYDPVDPNKMRYYGDCADTPA